MAGLVNRARNTARREGVSVLASKLLVNSFWNSLGSPLVFPAIRKLKDESRQCTRVEDQVRLVMTYRYLGLRISPLQVNREITELLDIVSSQRPRYILEIGTCSGGSLYLFSRVSSSDAELVSVDLPGGRFGGGYPVWKVPLFKSFASKNQKVTLIRGDSHEGNTLRMVKAALSGNRVDFLFIDGDHTYDGVKKDFQMYSGLVREGGVIALHDVAEDEDPSVGVSDFWKELRSRYDSREIINDVNQGWAGIGVIKI